MSFASYITISGFLSAILLVWAQLEANFAVNRKSNKCNHLNDDNQGMTAILLLWRYSALLIALLGIAIAGWPFILEPHLCPKIVIGWPLGLLVAVVVMVFADIGQTILLIKVKYLLNIPTGEQLIITRNICVRRMWLFGEILLILIIVSVSCIGNYFGWLALLIFLFIVGNIIFLYCIFPNYLLYVICRSLNVSIN